MIKTLRSLAIGAVGGAAFYAINLPLAWMLGSMCLATIFAVRGMDLTVDNTLRKIMTAVLGVMLGSSFTTETFSDLMNWSGGLALLVISTFISMTIVYLFYRRLCGFDRITAYFSAAPGGFNVMYETGEALGGDGRTIALIHASRIMLLVMTVPLAFRFGIAGDTPGTAASPSIFGNMDELLGYGLLLLAGALGYVLGKPLRLPAPHLMGPMVFCAAIHMLGITSAQPPMILIFAAQLVIGTSIGLRFLGTTVREIRRVILLSAVSTALMIAIAVFLAYEATDMIGISIPGLVLALSPGGLAEMSLVALTLGIDVAFVSVMHVVRIMMIIACVPALYPLVKRIWDRSDSRA